MDYFGLPWKTISIVGSIFAFVITTMIMWMSFSETLKTTRDIARVNLIRDLSKEFSEEQLFSQIMDSIVNCEVLYEKKGGKYRYDQINRFLGFLDDVSFFYSKDALDYNTVNHHFGGVIIETHLYKEVAQYIGDLQKTAGEQGALEDFVKLAKKIEEDPRRVKQVELYRRDCTKVGSKQGGSKI